MGSGRTLGLRNECPESLAKTSSLRCHCVSPHAYLGSRRLLGPGKVSLMDLRLPNRFHVKRSGAQPHRLMRIRSRITGGWMCGAAGEWDRTRPLGLGQAESSPGAGPGGRQVTPMGRGYPARPDGGAEPAPHGVPGPCRTECRARAGPGISHCLPACEVRAQSAPCVGQHRVSGGGHPPDCRAAEDGPAFAPGGPTTRSHRRRLQARSSARVQPGRSQAPPGASARSPQSRGLSAEALRQARRW